MTHRTLIERLDLIRSSFPQTPVVQLAHDHLDLFAKLEFSNPNGSAKDRSAHWILEQAVLRGEITEETTVVESSSGNFAVSLAAFCRMLNLPFLPVIDVNVNPSNETFLQTACPRVVKISSVEEEDGFLLERLRKVRELREEIPCVYWPNQYANPDAAQAHYTLTGGELEKAFGTIDYLFIGVGTGATIAGLSRRVREFSPGVNVIGVDAEGSMISGGPPKRRYIPGIGSSIHPPILDQAHIDEMLVVSEAEAVSGCRALLRTHGIFAGGSTGSVFSAIGRYFAGYRGPRPTVVFLCVDRGNAYTDTVYNDAWVQRTLGQQSRRPGPLPASMATS